MTPDGQLDRRDDRAREHVAGDEKRRAEEHRRGQHQPMIGADESRTSAAR